MFDKGKRKFRHFLSQLGASWILAGCPRHRERARAKPNSGPTSFLSSGPAQEPSKCLIHQDAQAHANRSRVPPKLVPGLTEVRVRALFHPKQLVPDMLIGLESRGPVLARVGHFKLRSKPSAPMITSTNR